jgi:hypothetical protein
VYSCLSVFSSAENHRADLYYHPVFSHSRFPVSVISILHLHIPEVRPVSTQVMMHRAAFLFQHLMAALVRVEMGIPT